MPPDEKDKPQIEPPAVPSPNLSADLGSDTSQAGMTMQELEASDAMLVKRLFQAWPPIWPTREEPRLTRQEEAGLPAARRDGRPVDSKEPLGTDFKTDEEINSYVTRCLGAADKKMTARKQASKARPLEPKKK